MGLSKPTRFWVEATDLDGNQLLQISVGEDAEPAQDPI
jgi:hypothetical protein